MKRWRQVKKNTKTTKRFPSGNATRIIIMLVKHNKRKEAKNVG